MTNLISKYEEQLIAGQAALPDVFVASLGLADAVDEATLRSLAALYEIHKSIKQVELPEGFEDRQRLKARELIARAKKVAAVTPSTEQVPLKRWQPIVLFLWAKGQTNSFAEEVVGRTRIVKETFLLGMETNVPRVASGFYYAKAGSYGPDNRELMKDLETLRDLGFVEMVPPSQSRKVRTELHEGLLEDEENTIFRLTPRGREYAQGLASKVTLSYPELLPALEKLKRSWNQRPLKGDAGLVTYVYKTYRPTHPELFEKSEIIDEIFGEDSAS